jgi:hypothetical protein
MVHALTVRPSIISGTANGITIIVAIEVSSMNAAV